MRESAGAQTKPTFDRCRRLGRGSPGGAVARANAATSEELGIHLNSEAGKTVGGGQPPKTWRSTAARSAVDTQPVTSDHGETPTSVCRAAFKVAAQLLAVTFTAAVVEALITAPSERTGALAVAANALVCRERRGAPRRLRSARSRAASAFHDPARRRGQGERGRRCIKTSRWDIRSRRHVPLMAMRPPRRRAPCSSDGASW